MQSITGLKASPAKALYPLPTFSPGLKQARDCSTFLMHKFLAGQKTGSVQRAAQMVCWRVATHNSRVVGLFN